MSNKPLPSNLMRAAPMIEKVTAHLLDIFDQEKAGVNYIDPMTLFESPELCTDFVFAIGVAAPATVVSRITDANGEMDWLTFNHNCNTLCMKYMLNKD